MLSPLRYENGVFVPPKNNKTAVSSNKAVSSYDIYEGVSDHAKAKRDKMDQQQH